MMLIIPYLRWLNGWDVEQGHNGLQHLCVLQHICALATSNALECACTDMVVEDCNHNCKPLSWSVSWHVSEVSQFIVLTIIADGCRCYCGVIVITIATDCHCHCCIAIVSHCYCCLLLLVYWIGAHMHWSMHIFANHCYAWVCHDKGDIFANHCYAWVCHHHCYLEDRNRQCKLFHAWVFHDKGHCHCCMIVITIASHCHCHCGVCIALWLLLVIAITIAS